ncbi:MAG: DUF2635 domain-containing protein [Alphaproteobacteria bacterium]|nr:DUF2635 domain-containing protein [Alphaproteobacteria bacterium]
MFVKAAEGKRVRKESGGLLANDGEAVPRNTFWRRRLKDGDVIETTAKAAKPVK